MLTKLSLLRQTQQPCRGHERGLHLQRLRVFLRSAVTKEGKEKKRWDTRAVETDSSIGEENAIECVVWEATATTVSSGQLPSGGTSDNEVWRVSPKPTKRRKKQISGNKRRRTRDKFDDNCTLKTMKVLDTQFQLEWGTKHCPEIHGTAKEKST